MRKEPGIEFRLGSMGKKTSRVIWSGINYLSGALRTKSPTIVRGNFNSKEMNVLFACLLSSTFLLAQENQITDIVNISFPAGCVKVSKEEFRTHAIDRKIDSLLITPFGVKGEYYLIDSFLLFLHGEHWVAPYHYLENLQRDMDGLGRTDGMNVKWVFLTRKISNYKVLISYIPSCKNGVLFFSSVNQRNNAVLNGTLLYNHSSTNDEKALKELNELLLGISYVL